MSKKKLPRPRVPRLENFANHMWQELRDKRNSLDSSRWVKFIYGEMELFDQEYKDAIAFHQQQAAALSKELRTVRKEVRTLNAVLRDKEALADCIRELEKKAEVDKEKEIKRDQKNEGYTYVGTKGRRVKCTENGKQVSGVRATGREK